MIKKAFVIAGLTLVATVAGYGQSVNNQNTNYIGQEIRTIWTSVPFLIIAPDSRASGYGDAGAATTPDINSMHWNPSKYAFIEGNMGLSLSYTPWLRKLVDDINLGYLTGYKRLDENQVIAASLLYFDLGSITFTDEFGTALKTHNPKEFSIDVAYSRKFSEKISGGIAARFINSNLAGNVGNQNSHPGRSYAMDVSAYYQDEMNLGGKNSKLGIGLNISNMGSKLNYTEDRKNFIPINMRMGSALTMELDKYNSIMFTLDVNKLLVPTPPIYVKDTATEELVIVSGDDPNVSVAVGMVKSFYDAPGGAKEELKEISFSTGAEYWYAKQFAIRMGYFYENEIKGNRKYFTAGLGLKLKVFGLDFSYLIPANNMNNNPLAETLRFTLLFDLDAISKN